MLPFIKCFGTDPLKTYFSTLRSCAQAMLFVKPIMTSEEREVALQIFTGKRPV